MGGWLYESMCEWMDGWVDGWVDRWVGGWVDGWVDWCEPMNVYMNGWIGGCTSREVISIGQVTHVVQLAICGGASSYFFKSN